MSIASTVIVAGLATPEISYRGEIYVHGSTTINNTITKMAVTSIGNRSVTKSARTRRMRAKPTNISAVTGAEAKP